MKKVITAVLAAITCCMVALLAACVNDEVKKPEKLKDGIALTITEGESKSIDLSEYISIEGTEYAYTVKSSAPTVATVTVDGNTATVTAVAKGNATVTASADTVSVTFAVTVQAAQSNLPADKTALVAELALEVTAQGDYTLESYNAYTAKVEAAKAINAKTDATQTEVDTACNELKTAREGLVLRVPEEVADAEKTLVVVSGLSKEIDISDYIDAKNLSSVTYEASSANTLVTVGEIEDGKFTVTAGVTEQDVNVALIICAKYKGESKLTVTLTLQVKSEVQPTVNKAQVTQSVDIYSLENKTALTIDFTENVESNGVENLVYSVTSGGNPVTLDSNNCLSYNLNGTYSETSTDVVFNVSVTYGEGKSISYVYTLKITDTTAYKVVNGGFDQDLTGWTLDGEIGAISETSTFWASETFEGYPVHNVGKYFAGNEPNEGTLTSSSFKVGGINKITFKLGAAGNSECYITLEKKDGTVLAIWRNTKFCDLPAGTTPEEGLPMIGNTVFACNLVTYVADLTAYAGQTLKVVLHDNATSGFGFFNFDELVTYYKAEAELPENVVAAVNELANKAELQTAVGDALTDQGDYTLESYNAYVAKVAEAQEILDKVSATQAEVDAAKSGIETAQDGLKLRIPEEKDVVKTVALKSDAETTVDPSNFVDTKDLSSITYELSSESTKLTIAGMKITAETVGEDSDETVTLTVKYKGEIKLEVELTVKLTSGDKPVVKQPEVANDIDICSQTDKTKIKLNFAENIENPADLTLTYSVTIGDSNEELTLDSNNCYEYAFAGNYNDTATAVVFTVVVGSEENSLTASYTYTLNIKDTRAYRITNGGFDSELDSGLEGWTLSNPDLGGVNGATTYWNENIPFNNDGNFFNAYFFDGEGREGAMGTLTSSPFTIGGSCWITYKLGGAKNADKVYLDIIENSTGNILARYSNNAFSDGEISDKIRGCTLVAYKADLSAHKGKTVYIRISDNAIREYGLFFVDSFVTYYPEAPTEGNVAVAVTNKPANIYQLFNGGFETGYLTGWELIDGEVPGRVSSNSTWYTGTSYGKVGTYLFAAGEGGPAEENQDSLLEHLEGTIRSSVFTLKAKGWISFKLGGAKNPVTGIRVVKADGTVLAQFHNTAFAEGTLIQYVYQFENLAEDTDCYIEIYDNATGDWGLVNIDEIITDYDGAPSFDGATTAINQI